MRHEQFFSLKSDENFGLFSDGTVKADEPKNRSQYVQKDKRVFKKKYIDMAKEEYDNAVVANDMYAEFMANHAAIGEDMDSETRRYDLFSKNCQDYTQCIIRRAEKIAKDFKDTLYIVPCFVLTLWIITSLHSLQWPYI